MEATVVIPAYNARDWLHACLISLNHQQGVGSFEVVVVDDGSTDGTGDMVRAVDVTYEMRYRYIPRGPQSSRAAARNVGILTACGDIVVMIDADQVLPPVFLREHLSWHADNAQLVVLGPRVFLASGRVDLGLLSTEFRWEALPPVDRPDKRDRLFAALSANLNDLATCWHQFYTCNASVSRENLLGVDGFDEGFTGWGLEDSELGYRLRQRGLAFAYNPKAALYHEARGPREQNEEWRRNLSYFIAKHPGPEVALQRILDPLEAEVRGSRTWLESCLRFEYAVRAIDGRLPGLRSPKIVDVREADVEPVLSRIVVDGASQDLLIFDHTEDSRIPLLIQTMKTDAELSYFHHPDAETRAAVLARYGLR